MRALGSIWSWLVIGLVCLVGFGLQVVLFVLTFPFDRRRLVCGRWFRGMGVVCSRLIPFWHFGVLGEAPRHIHPRTVVVSNHASQADPFLISHLPWEMKWLGKAVLFRIPIIGWSMWLAGDIPVKRGAKSSVYEALQRCRFWLDRGVPVMIFPEGTRSADGALLPFKDGAFRLALDAGAEILPLAVEGTPTALPKHSWLFGTSQARVAVGKPISTAGRTVDELKAEARVQIEALRAGLRKSLAVPALAAVPAKA